MRKSLFVFGTIAFLVFGASFAEAQDKVAMYPYSVFNEKPLPVGTAVWVNVGDDECTYGYWRQHPDSKFSYAMPSASDECFKGYREAKIVKIHSMYGRYLYRVEIDPQHVRSVGGGGIEWNATFDDLYEIFNLPEKWAKYSKYFLALNW